MCSPSWLPAIVSTDGEWNTVCAMLYDVYAADFIHANPTLQGFKVFRDRRILEGEVYEEGFWHLISRDDNTTGERLFDPRRAERLPWCSPTICNCSDPAVKIWDHNEGRRKIRTYVWLEQLDYVVVLEKRPHRTSQVAFLVTAYHVDYSSTRRRLQNKYKNRVP